MKLSLGLARASAAAAAAATVLTILASLALVGVLSAPAGAAAVRVLLDGQELAFDVPPMLINDRTMVPFRKLFEALGASVSWDEATRTVTGVRGTTTIRLVIGSATATVNGAAVALDAPPVLVGGRTLVPLRFVSENLGERVEWDQATRTVRITRGAGAGAGAGAGTGAGYGDGAGSGYGSGSGYGAPPGSGAVTVRVDVGDFFFSPATLRVQRGAQVSFELRNTGAIGHTFTIQALGIDRTLAAGATDTVTVVAGQAGTFTVVCRFHPAMAATLTVE